MVAQVDCLKRCEPLVLVSFSCSTSVAPETSTIRWCILKIIISHEMYLLRSSNSQPKSCTIFVTQPGALSVYAEWTNLAAFRWTCSNFWRKSRGFGSHTGDEYSNVCLTIVVYAVAFTCLLQSPRLRRINPRVLLALLVVMSTCFCQVRSSLNVTPRYLLLSVVCRTWLCRVYVVLILSNYCVGKNVKK